MKKLLFSLLAAVMCFTLLTTTASAMGLISTTLWGDGTIRVHRQGVEHVTVVNNDTVIIKDFKVVIKPVSIGHTTPQKIVITLNGRKICSYNSRQIMRTNTCVIGDLPSKGKVDIALTYKGKSKGLDEWVYYVYHDGWVTPVDFALTIK